MVAGGRRTIKNEARSTARATSATSAFGSVSSVLLPHVRHKALHRAHTYILRARATEYVLFGQENMYWDAVCDTRRQICAIGPFALCRRLAGKYNLRPMALMLAPNVRAGNPAQSRASVFAS